MRRKLTALIALATTACSSWQLRPAPTPSTGAGASESISQARVYLRTGATLDLHEVTVAGDSLVGMSGPASQADRRRVAVPTANVSSIAVREVDAGRTALAILAIAGASIVIIGAAACASLASSY
jgi:hypothetical protein